MVRPVSNNHPPLHTIQQNQVQAQIPELTPSPVIHHLQPTNASLQMHQIPIPTASVQSMVAPHSSLIPTLPCGNTTLHPLPPATYAMHNLPVHNTVSLHSLQNTSQVVHTLANTTVQTVAAPNPAVQTLPPGTNPTAPFPFPTPDSANMAVQELQDMISMIQQGNYRPGFLNSVHSLHGTGRV